MSIVMPAGKSTLNWSPIMKQASAGGKKVVEVDELYEAAKKVVAGIIPGVPDGTGPHGMGAKSQTHPTASLGANARRL